MPSLLAAVRIGKELQEEWRSMILRLCSIRDRAYMNDHWLCSCKGHDDIMAHWSTYVAGAKTTTHFSTLGTPCDFYLNDGFPLHSSSSLHTSTHTHLLTFLASLSTMSDKKGNYSAVPTTEDDLALTQAFQPPPYTPSASSSPFIQSQHVVGGPSTQIIYSPAPQQQLSQTVYQAPKPANTAHPHPPTASPLVLTSPPCRIEDLKTKPRIVVCPHCNYLVLTETTPENGKNDSFSAQPRTPRQSEN